MRERAKQWYGFPVAKVPWSCPECGEKEKDDVKCIKCGALLKKPKKGT